MSELPKPEGLQKIEEIVVKNQAEDYWVIQWAEQGILEIETEINEREAKRREFGKYLLANGYLEPEQI